MAVLKYPHPKNPRSKVSIALAKLLTNSIDDTPGLSPCQLKKGDCPLAPGIEHLFVACLAERALERVRADEDSITFEDIIYSPHSSIEGKCGFDLSIGHYDRPCRVRLLHKLVGGKWCDLAWEWTSRDDIQTHRHLMKVLSVYEDPACKGLYEPFICIHVCFCVHEYRRMGAKCARTTIPRFEDPSRTVVVDLRPIIEIAGWKQFVTAPDSRLVVHRHPVKQIVTAKALKKAQLVTELPTLTVEELLAHAAARVAQVQHTGRK